MDETKIAQLKEKLLEIISPLIITKCTDFDVRSLYNEIEKEWLVALFYKRAGRIDSIVIATGKEEIIKEAEKLLDGFIEDKMSTNQFLKL